MEKKKTSTTSKHSYIAIKLIIRSNYTLGGRLKTKLVTFLQDFLGIKVLQATLEEYSGKLEETPPRVEETPTRDTVIVKIQKIDALLVKLKAFGEIKPRTTIQWPASVAAYLKVHKNIAVPAVPGDLVLPREGNFRLLYQKDFPQLKSGDYLFSRYRAKNYLTVVQYLLYCEGSLPK